MSLGRTFILGDSYSTFKGYIPEGYESWYATKPNEATDVFSVEQTWWYPLFNEGNAELVHNDSFSGSTVCNTGYEGYDYSEISFIGRFKRLCEAGFFEDKEINTFLLFGATNDSWADSPLGELSFGEVKPQDSYKFFPAFCQLVRDIKATLPGARVIFILNHGLKEEINEGTRQICARYGVEFLPLPPIDLRENHPTCLGMEQIKSALLCHLSQNKQ